jgi:hypothetical protein
VNEKVIARGSEEDGTISPGLGDDREVVHEAKGGRRAEPEGGGDEGGQWQDDPEGVDAGNPYSRARCWLPKWGDAKKAAVQARSPEGDIPESIAWLKPRYSGDGHDPEDRRT